MQQSNRIADLNIFIFSHYYLHDFQHNSLHILQKGARYSICGLPRKRRHISQFSHFPLRLQTNG